MTIKKNSYHNLLLFASVLLVFIPPALISGPFIPDLFIVIISIIFLYIYSHNKDELILFRSFFFKLFLVFYIYLILVSILSDHFYQSLKPSLTYIRFGLFSLAIFFILTKKKDFKLQFFIVLYFTIFILIFDGYFQ